MKTIKQLKEMLDNQKAKNAWGRGVVLYAYELIEELGNKEGDDYEFYGSPMDKKKLLNGAVNWLRYSEGGCSLIYDGDIAKRLCTPSELKGNKNGNNPPNTIENWIACQARALHAAEMLIFKLCQ